MTHASLTDQEIGALPEGTKVHTHFIELFQMEQRYPTHFIELFQREQRSTELFQWELELRYTMLFQRELR